MPALPGLTTLRAQGYLVVRGVVTDVEPICAHLDAAKERFGARPDGWGVEVVPLLERAPALAPCFAAIQTALQDALGPCERLYDGARYTSLGHQTELPWHFHAELGGDGRWDPLRPGAPERIERVIASVYLDGTAGGALRVFPRAEGDPWRPPFPDPSAAWPGSVDLEMAPGDLAVWDVATFHAARHAGRTRRIVGGIWSL
jgi:hypothetical protein